MRPIRLDLEGFASFRDATSLDLDDADVFVLAGPTGAGKSSLIDAMTFALYGSVARYDDRRLVAPIISQGMAEARVRLHFSVGDANYTAVRVVRRTKTGGATTKEARLEKWRGADPDDADVMAGTADDVNASIESLLGLTFEHFTTCIALPQGAFQAFLHAKPKDRNDLLVELLDLDVYRKVGVLARERSSAQQQRADMLQGRLDGDLALATDEALTAAASRRQSMDDLVTALDDAQPRLDEIRAEGTQLAEQADAAKQTAAQLRTLQIPEGVADLSARLAAARTVRDKAATAAEEASQSVTSCEQAVDDTGDVAPLRTQQERLAELTGLGSRLADEQSAMQAAEQLAAERAHAVDSATALVATAEVSVRDAERADLAATLAHDLHAGDDCPVCARPLDQDPTLVPSGTVTDARDELAAARNQLQQASADRASSEQAVTRHRTQLEGLQQRRDQLTATVDDSGLPTDPDVLTKALSAAEDAQQALAAARTAERQALEAERQARRDAEAAEQAVAAAWQAFDEAWQQVARHDPPAVSDRGDLVGSWTTLVGWAAVRGPELDAQAVAAEFAVEQTRARWRDERATLEQACRQAGLEVPGGDIDLRDLAVRALERATADVRRLEELIAESARLRDELGEARRQHQIAKALGNHLTARKFEQWLLRRALQRLVAGATVILNDLSNGSYSLSLDDNNNFQVTDHRNADQLRSARTLSGGETFLASLALALALAEHVADLSAQGAARLEALFLDEGFGTLDADTLDVVASALEELGSRGRMVGVITHVPDLAQRMPVRFDVRKVGASSTVTRANDLGAQT